MKKLIYIFACLLMIVGCKTSEGVGELIFSLYLIVDGAGVHGCSTCLGDGFEERLFVIGIALYGSNELGDEIVALLELHVDVGEGIFAVVAKAYEAVISADGPESNKHDNDENNDDWC